MDTQIFDTLLTNKFKAITDAYHIKTNKNKKLTKDPI